METLFKKLSELIAKSSVLYLHIDCHQADLTDLPVRGVLLSLVYVVCALGASFDFNFRLQRYIQENDISK